MDLVDSIPRHYHMYTFYWLIIEIVFEMNIENKWTWNVGFPEMLFLVFLTLKLVGISAVATWSWWWVTAPLWGSFAITFLASFITFIILDLSDKIKEWKEK